jgi:hypothetical protein
MPRNNYPMQLSGRLPVAALLLLALLAPGCSSSSVNAVTTATPPTATPPAAPGTAAAPPAVVPSAVAAAPPPPPPSPSLKDKVASFFSGNTANEPRPVANGTQPDVDCPFIDIRQGASTLTIPPPPVDGGNEAMALKYQGDFVRAARECKVLGNQMVMKVGVQGRIIVGPAGGPGQVDVPLRIAVVEAPQAGAKMITTKLIHIPVTIGPDGANATFTHIEEGLSFPLPSSVTLDSYIVYIGFDPIGAAAEDRRAAPAAKTKPKAKPNPNTPTG